jgi:hypothetical protein
VAHRFPFADFSQVQTGCPSDRVMDEGHRRCNFVQSADAPEGDRTPDLPVSNQTLYPSELRARRYNNILLDRFSQPM